MKTTIEYKVERLMTYKEFIKSDLCKKMVREEKEKERMLRAKNGENVKKLDG